MLIGRFDTEDVRRGGEFCVDAVNERTQARSGVFVYRDRGDGQIEIGFTSEYEGRELQRALVDAAEALRFRADKIAAVAPKTEAYAELIERHRGHAHVLEKHAREIAE